MNWLAHVLGLDSGSGYWYLFWSGFGSDLPILAAVAVYLRHHNCHEPGCWRLGRHPDPISGGVHCHRHVT